METWDVNKEKEVEIPQKQLDFLDEIEAVCKKYNLSISHEDGWGSFVIDKYSKENIEWLRNAHINWI
jgi:hypothetical protein